MTLESLRARLAVLMARHELRAATPDYLQGERQHRISAAPRRAKAGERYTSRRQRQRELAARQPQPTPAFVAVSAHDSATASGAPVASPSARAIAPGAVATLSGHVARARPLGRMTAILRGTAAGQLSGHVARRRPRDRCGNVADDISRAGRALRRRTGRPPLGDLWAEARAGPSTDAEPAS